MSALIPSLFLHQGPTAAKTTADFSSESASSEAATNRSIESMETYGGASGCFTAVCVAK